MITYSIPTTSESITQVRTAQTLKLHTYGAFKASVDDKAYTSILTFDFHYPLNTLEKTKPGPVIKQLDKALAKAHREIRDVHPDLIKRHMAVGSLTLKTDFLLPGKRLNYDGEYIILLKHPGRLIKIMPELNDLEIVKSIATILDKHIAQAFQENEYVELK